jgi:hypothetical protein
LIPLGDGRGFKWRATPSGSPLGAFGDNTITTIAAIAKKKAIEETAQKK